MQLTFFNTTNLSGSELSEKVSNAENQQSEILEYFKAEKILSPSDVFKKLDQKYLLTSVRRAITVLTKQQFLERTPDKKVGLYGSKEYLWKLKNVA
jgi:Fe2+ or Zn2+ uptake regulation protein